jgi:hypothetical protein
MTPEVVVPDTAAAEEQLAAKKAAAEKSGAARVVPMRGPRERAEPERAAVAAAGPGGEAASGAGMSAAKTVPNTLPSTLPSQREIPWESPLVVEDDARAVHRRPSTPYVIAAAVAVVLVTLFTLYGILHHPSSGPQATAPIAQSGTHPAKQAAATPEKTVVMKPAAAPASASGPGWRVIVYTYNREAEARHKAETITAAHPELKASVFRQRAGEPYLVSLGGVMSRPEAIALRAKALSMGMPRDTYARNYR